MIDFFECKSKTLFFCTLFYLLFATKFYSQNIPPTNSILNCAICAPTGWQIINGTPDISDRFIAAAAGSSFEGGIPWDNAPLPLPINNHLNWISLRDVTSSFPEEIVGTVMSDLTVELSYEITIYSMTTRSTASPGYSPQYNDFFKYKIGDNEIVEVSELSHDEWQINTISFVAHSENMNLEFYPGNNAIDLSNMESIQISISQDAINAIPVADDNSETTDINTPVTFIVTDTDYDPDGNIDVSTVDLDPLTPGFQSILITAEGTWTVDSFGFVTFTPVEGFLGTATINYTVNDDYILDGINSSATSNQAILSVLVIDPCDSILNDGGLLIYQGFSPNGDNLNDYFTIEGLECFPDNELKVYNRWGEFVYEAKGYMNNWDGTSKRNEVLPVGVYYFVLRLNMTLKPKTGWVYLNKN